MLAFYLFLLSQALFVRPTPVSVGVNWTMTCRDKDIPFVYQVDLFELDWFLPNDFLARFDGHGLHVAVGELSAVHTAWDWGEFFEFFLRIRHTCGANWDRYVFYSLKPYCWYMQGGCNYFNLIINLEDTE